MFEAGLGSATGALTKAIVAGAATGATTKKGLDLVDTEIDDVIDILNKELKEIEDNNFEVAGRIEKASFGQGTEAVNLGNDHAKAHVVVVQTLTDLIEDLNAFRKEVKDARALLYETDQDAKVRLTSTLNRAENLDLGHYAYRDAQDDHRGETPADDPPEGTDDETGDA